MNLIEKIKGGESDTIEFKETFRYDVKTCRKNSELKNEVSRSVCAMLNSNGGVVLVGVANDKTIEGLERDFNLYGDGDQPDKMLIDVNAHITETLGIDSKQSLDISYEKIKDKVVLIIGVSPSFEVPFHHGEEEHFYIWDGPRTIKLLGKNMGGYISARVKKRSEKHKRITQKEFNPLQKARGLLNIINSKELSEILPEFHYFLAKIGDREEIRWVEAELSGEIYEAGKDNPEFFEYRGIRGYISPYKIASLGNSSLDIIAANPDNLMKEFNYIPSISVFEMERKRFSGDSVGMITLGEEILKCLKLEKTGISNMYFYFKPSAILHIISNIKQKMNKYLMKFLKSYT